MAATRQLISITNHPKIAEITRKVAIIKSQPYYKYDGLPTSVEGNFKKAIILDLLVLHYDKNGDYIKMGGKSGDGLIYLISDESDYVNPLTFEKVEKNVLQEKENPTDPDVFDYPEGSMLEYDVLWSMLYDAKNVTDIQLQEQFITLRMDKIDEKLYNI